ncbi:twin-arginine translocase subunit TatC [Effusibacillus dendaii]|uniref:Sec-independent protein translocase protein TatC n=1 Tax=Effusibacillus dendaii TaxID=2743772 RepID=A0A7I8DAT4_9BACL|nr:twin-arginine translocase subunit TatC [Effusibacillus dendaii]BCJ85630.1 sec-independent protein translocase protein TatC [Effusibacillus dendaii]
MSVDKSTLVEHLAELRKRLIYTVVVFLVFLILSFFYVDRIFGILKGNLPAGMKLTALGPGDVLHVYVLVGSLAALALTLPFALVQAWLFIKPALSRKEQRWAITYIPGVILMFVLGVLFAWYVIFPMLLSFLIRLGSQQFTVLMTASSYFGLMTNIVLPLGFFFDMPVVVLFLTRIGIITPQQLTRFRKYAYLVLVVIASMISPPEFISHLSVAVPLILLYEISIWISKWAYRNRGERLSDSNLVKTDTDQ